MKLALPLLASALAALGQTPPPVQVGGVYAPIDGSTCVINKYANATVRAQVVCANYNGSIQTVMEIYSIATTYTTPFTAGMGASFCLVFANPSGVAVTQPPFGSVAASTLAWQCSVNTPTGPVVPVGGAGSISWP